MTLTVRVCLMLALWVPCGACGGVQERDAPEGDDGGDGDGMDPAPVEEFAVAPASPRLFLRQGQSAGLDVTIVRASDFTAAVTVELDGLPAGVSAPAVTIAAGETSGTLTVTAAGDSTQGALDLDIIGAAESITRSARLRLVVAGEPGTLDQSFAGGGKLTFQLSGMASTGRGLLIQPDGKVVVTGDGGDRAVTLRLNEDGSFDDSFGAAGVVTTAIGDFTGGMVVRAARDGRLLVGGLDSPDGELLRIALFAYTSEGALDAGFGSGGTLVVDTAPDTSLVSDVVELADGDFLIVGDRIAAAPAPGSLLINRVTAAGELDPNFTITGPVLSPNATLLDGEGRLVVAGVKRDTDLQSFIARYLPDGSPDASFGGDGVVETNVVAGQPDLMSGLVELESGQLLVTGHAVEGETGFLTQLRYNPDGALDPTFGDGGIVIGATPMLVAGNGMAAVDALGRSVVAGSSQLDDPGVLTAVARILPDGTIDTTFGDSGLVNVQFGQGQFGASEASGIGIDPDGRIVVSAHTGDLAVSAFGVARLWP